MGGKRSCFCFTFALFRIRLRCPWASVWVPYSRVYGSTVPRGVGYRYHGPVQHCTVHCITPFFPYFLGVICFSCVTNKEACFWIGLLLLFLLPAPCFMSFVCADTKYTRLDPGEWVRVHF
ncbi:hypothetical protein B0T26DRAFT_527458 [Lasiosphaeria miniovina]|uniref:Uncharacterized protein n=1 Tax=Lasiosphaeria miniovina TaxID=1954250 RepID=A0AA39ZQC2_9PEZI|nr:uncharacterized protein B0T26DRAFT_527458 [Lasiosphaeria miniovina]KAK0701686.1 hypothetical protein B0T26DRAFT_527458 [Lasiosphaeria miniovina]